MLNRPNATRLVKSLFIGSFVLSISYFFIPEKEIPAQTCTIVYAHPDVVCPPGPQPTEPQDKGCGT